MLLFSSPHNSSEFLPVEHSFMLHSSPKISFNQIWDIFVTPAESPDERRRYKDIPDLVEGDLSLSNVLRLIYHKSTIINRKDVEGRRKMVRGTEELLILP